MVEAWTHLHPHLVIGGDNGAVIEVVLLYEQGDEVHVLEDQVRLSAQAEMLSLHGQQLACCFKGAHLKVLAGTHLVLQHQGLFVYIFCFKKLFFGSGQDKEELHFVENAVLC